MILWTKLSPSYQGELPVLLAHQMAWDVHEPQIVWTRQLYLRSFEQSIMLLAHKEGIIDGFLTHVSHARICAYDTDVVGVWIQLIQSDMLTNEDSDPYPAHIETVQEGLNRPFDLLALGVVLLQFEYALRDRGDDRVMALLDLDEGFRKSFIVLVHFWRPVHLEVGIRIVPDHHPQSGEQ